MTCSAHDLEPFHPMIVHNLGNTRTWPRMQPEEKHLPRPERMIHREKGDTLDQRLRYVCIE